MAGWEQYINFIVSDNKCEFGFIVGKEQANIWACNAGIAALPTYQVNVEGQNFNCNEADLLIKALKNNGVPTDMNVGIRINKEKYYTVRFDAELGTWYLKKDKGGACIAVTKQALIIGTFNGDKKQTPGVANATCEKLAESLKGAGY